MSSMYTDDQDTIHISGTLTARDARELRRMVQDAFLMHDEPIATLTLAFDEAAAVGDDAVIAVREALGDALALCAERNAALRLVPSPALRRLSTAA
jgi:hypothetical protein